MYIACILIPALLLLAGLIHAEESGSSGKIVLFKAPLSLLFIVSWSLQTARYPLFSNLILVALLFCFAGDLLLAFYSRRAFLAGLISFLFGHVAYAAAFFLVAEVGATLATGVILLMAAAVPIWRWLSPFLGSMQNPVAAYMVVISTMVAGALGVYGNSNLPEGVKASILAGALLFYGSDLFVARERFVVKDPVNRRLGLPMYYCAQFLLAFSAARLDL